VVVQSVEHFEACVRLDCWIALCLHRLVRGCPLFDKVTALFGIAARSLHGQLPNDRKKRRAEAVYC